MRCRGCARRRGIVRRFGHSSAQAVSGLKDDTIAYARRHPGVTGAVVGTAAGVAVGLTVGATAGAFVGAVTAALAEEEIERRS